jgi:DNA-binding LytR/AlgR family response regulator
MFNVIIIEDDTLLAERISHHLMLEGFQVCGIADNQHSTNEILSKNAVDIALVDINLNGPENGIVIANELVRNNSVAVIYISGESSDEIIEKSKKTHPTSFLIKPLDMREVVTQVKIVAHNLEHGNFLFPGSGNSLESIHIPGNKGLMRFKKQEIAYIIADRAHSKLFLTRDAHQRMFPNNLYSYIQVWIHMGKIAEQLPWYFYRLSRSMTVNLNQIDLIGQDSITIQQNQLPLPDGARSTLLNRLNIVKAK